MDGKKKKCALQFAFMGKNWAAVNCGLSQHHCRVEMSCTGSDHPISIRKGCEPTRIAFLFSNKELVVILDFTLLPNYYNLLFIFILLLHSICLNGICKEIVLKVKVYWKLKVGDKNPAKWMTKFLISLIQRKVSVTEKCIMKFE